ncbi:MAG: hypothetical protein JNL45_14240 [Hyphomicrobium sp.]|jgi:hypothetical protein|nr:hypothetical protein [Hyphomicrobium sp.]
MRTDDVLTSGDVDTSPKGEHVILAILVDGPSVVSSELSAWLGLGASGLRSRGRNFAAGTARENRNFFGSRYAVKSWHWDLEHGSHEVAATELGIYALYARNKFLAAKLGY